MKLCIRGVHYADVNECAKALGVKPITVYSALSKGREQFLGTGRGRSKGFKPTSVAKPIELGGMKFRSHRQLSIFLGQCPQYVSGALANGRYHLIIAKMMKRLREQELAALDKSKGGRR